MYRIGIGQDSHSFSQDKKRSLILGGVRISASGGLSGNSDTDVILHSLCNALSSALGGDSLSTWADEMLKKDGIGDSRKYVDNIFRKIKDENFKVENVSVAVEAKRPKISLDVINKIKKNIAILLDIDKKQVGITFTSGEGLTPFGRGLGIAAICIVLLSK